ncbi:hypothetical protein AOQ84DRAFT_360925 [Glonium stellatum]|uniref:Clr5 domain-containing protein n=1 Tax=Glonium stellatum TaxID=574774 RepID=A0A8E2F7Q0_9PEZI|nr:hypothetical protein AOQ84DRAFT_360925 [Glonium stellatum]
MQETPSRANQHHLNTSLIMNRANWQSPAAQNPELDSSPIASPPAGNLGQPQAAYKQESRSAAAGNMRNTIPDIQYSPTHEFLIILTMDDANNAHLHGPAADKHKNNSAVFHGSGISKDRGRTLWASPENFDANIKVLIPLYENMPLCEVMKIMQEEHGFFATANQYKRKFSQWRQEGRTSVKRYTPVELQTMIRKATQRKTEENKESALFYRGRHVEHDRIERFERRNVRSSDVGQTSECQTPSAISCRTPSVTGASSSDTSDVEGMIIPTKGNMAYMKSAPSLGGSEGSLTSGNVEEPSYEVDFAEVFQSPDSSQRIHTAISQMAELLNQLSLIARDFSSVPVDIKNVYELWDLTNRLWLSHSEQAVSLQMCLQKCAGRIQLEQSSSAPVTSNESDEELDYSMGDSDDELAYIDPIEQNKNVVFCCGAGPYMWPFSVGCVDENCMDHKFCKDCHVEFDNFGQSALQTHTVMGRPMIYGKSSLNVLKLYVR